MNLPRLLAVLAPLLATLALTLSPPHSWAAAALAVLVAAGAGLAARVPEFFVGRPLVSAPLAATLAGLSAFLFDASMSAPEGWIRAALLAGAVVCAGVSGVPIPVPRSPRGR
jgi:hypothetical protein